MTESEYVGGASWSSAGERSPELSFAEESKDSVDVASGFCERSTSPLSSNGGFSDCEAVLLSFLNIFCTRRRTLLPAAFSFDGSSSLTALVEASYRRSTIPALTLSLPLSVDCVSAFLTGLASTNEYENDPSAEGIMSLLTATCQSQLKTRKHIPWAYTVKSGSMRPW